MEGWIFGSVGMLVGIAGVVFGLRAEVRATRRDRKEAFAEEPPPWSDPIYVSGLVWKFRNDGRRTVIVTGVRAEKPEWQGAVRPRRSLPATVGLTDTLPVLVSGNLGGTPAFFLEWHWDGDSVERETRRAVA